MEVRVNEVSELLKRARSTRKLAALSIFLSLTSRAVKWVLYLHALVA